MRILGHTLMVATTIGLAFVLTPACVDNDQSIFIRAALAPSATRTNGFCVYTGDSSQAQLFEGVVDIAVRDNYGAVLLIGNELIQRGDNATPRAEPNRAHINGAIVRVTDANGGSIGEFTSLGTGFVDPATGTAITYSPIGIVAIDAPTLAKIGANLPVGQTKLVLANIKAFGETVGGVDLESGEYQFPIRVCNGCLISFATGDDPLTPGVDCNLVTTTAGTTGGGGTVDVPPCAEGQDEIEPCQLCRLSRDACKKR